MSRSYAPGNTHLHEVCIMCALSVHAVFGAFRNVCAQVKNCFRVPLGKDTQVHMYIMTGECVHNVIQKHVCDITLSMCKVSHNN